MKKYQIIYADPPWKYQTWTELKTKKLRRKCGSICYPTMTTKEIAELPVNEIADEKCILFIWITMPKLNEVFTVIKSWGFIYKTVAFTWIKLNPSGVGYYSGLGHWTLGNPEFCLLATHKKFPKRIKSVKQLVVYPRGRHSEKPALLRNKIVELVGDLPRIELFARKEKQLFGDEGWEGWDVWGNEVESDIELKGAKQMTSITKEYQITASTKFTVLAGNKGEVKEAAEQHLKYKWDWGKCPEDVLTIELGGEE